MPLLFVEFFSQFSAMLQGRCERRSEVFVKFKKKNLFFFWGGGGGGGGGGEGGGGGSR